MRRVCLAIAAGAGIATLAAAQQQPPARLRSVEAHLTVSGCAISVAETYSFSSWPGSETFARDLPYAVDRLSTVSIALGGAAEVAAEVASFASSADDFWKTRCVLEVCYQKL